MDDKVGIAEVILDRPDGIMVTFSDGTTAGYVAEELLELRPSREHAVLPVPASNPTR
jgi:hypothetical protein